MKYRIFIPDYIPIMRALYVGRFQPFHKGHLAVVRKIAKESDTLALVIANSEASGTDTDPFTAHDRKEMIRRALIEEDIYDKIEIYAQRDVGDDDLWASEIMDKIGYADIAYTGNGWTSRCLEPYMKIEVLKMIERDIYSGTLVRKLIKEKDARWKKCVPPAVASYLEETYRL